MKAPGVERVIRTLRTAIQRHFEATQTNTWEQFLPQFIHLYNHRVHSTTKQRPAVLLENPTVLPKKLKSPPKRPITLPPVGSYVRLNRLRSTFDKESSGNFTEEIFRVTRHKTTSPIPLIYVSDLQGDPVLGGLYPQEYQAVVFNGKKRIEHVIKRRKRRGHPPEYFVSFRGYPKKFNEWVTTVV